MDILGSVSGLLILVYASSCTVQLYKAPSRCDDGFFVVSAITHVLVIYLDVFRNSCLRSKEQVFAECGVGIHFNHCNGIAGCGYIFIPDWPHKADDFATQMAVAIKLSW